MKNIKFIIVIFFSGIMFLTSCLKDLNTVPLDKDEALAGNVFVTEYAYKQFLAKIYGALQLTGRQGPHGESDLSSDFDEGFSSYLRLYWQTQELTTDEALIGWSDYGVKDLHAQNWSANNGFVSYMYNRIYYQVSLCNEFIREASDENLDARAFSDSDKEIIAMYKNEARFLRALSYWHAIDLFANVPFITDEHTGVFTPERILRADLFNYVEAELLELESILEEAQTNEYGRADQAAAQMILAKLYLNAGIYTGTETNTEAITYCNKIINAGYSLETEYKDLFLADNNNSNEIIFPIVHSGITSKSWGGCTFIIHAAVGGDDMTATDYGIDPGWGGLRTTSAFVSKFSDVSGATDSRAMFFTDNHTREVNDLAIFEDGYAIVKFKNITSDGTQGTDLTFVDTDFPMFRLGDVYLMYAEAVLRGGTGGDAGTALSYVNALRERAYGDTDDNITAGELTLDFILDERARELHWEAHRRTDLIRYGKFSSTDYVWAWKGDEQAGISTDAKFDLFPIPEADLGANTNLIQNPGY